MLAPRDQRHVRSAASQHRTDKSADRPSTEDRDSHHATNALASMLRWTLPVGPFGIESAIWISRGILNGASWPLQCSISSLGPTPPRVTTTAWTTSPYFSSGAA